MNRGIRKIISLIVFSTITVGCFCGCSTNSRNIEMGRYEEKELSQIEDLSKVFSLRKIDDDTLCVIGSDKDNNFKWYESSDEGKSFDIKNVNLNPEESGDGLRVESGYIDKDGSIYLSCNEYNSDNYSKLTQLENLGDKISDSDTDELNKISASGKKVLYKINSFLKCSEISHEDIGADNSESILGISNNNIYINADYSSDNYMNQRLLQIDIQTGKVKNKVDIKGDTIDNASILGDKLICTLGARVKCFNLNNLKDVGNLKNFNNYQYENNNIFSRSKGNDVYTVKDKGIYKYDMRTHKLYNIIQSALSLFGDNTYKLACETISEDNKIFAAFYSEDGKTVIYKYGYNKNLPSKPSKQITVYSMYDSEDSQQVINAYAKSHKDVCVKCEYGITNGDKTTTLNDAVKKLNVELMAGKGPDVILSDGLTGFDTSNYEKKDMFYDLSDVIKDNKDELLNNVVKAYRKKNKIYEFPIQIEMPVITGNNVSNINDLESLNKAVTKAYNDGQKNIMYIYNAHQLFCLLYYSCCSSWIKEDKTIDKDKIKAFLQQSKSIYEKCSSSTTDSVKSKLKIITSGVDGDEPNAAEAMFLINGSLKTSFDKKDLPLYDISYCYSIGDIATDRTIYDKAEKSTYNVWNGQIGPYFLPMLKFSVSARSKNIDTAKDFVSFLISEKYQNKVNGTPVNKKVLKKKIDEENKEGYGSICFGDNGEDQAKVESLDKNIINKYVSDIESLNNVCSMDKLILNQAGDEFEKYISGENTNIDETVDKMCKKLEICLAE